jgi:hypothetical protein
MKKSRLNEIAQDLFNAGHVSFDDEVTLCTHVSRKFGVELTLKQATAVFDRLDELHQPNRKG